MKIIDCHSHVVAVPVGGKLARIEELAENMKRNGISKSIVFTSLARGGVYDYPLEDLMKGISRGKMKLAYTVNVNGDLEEQASFIEESLVNKRIVGIKIMLGYHHIHADDGRLDKLYELCEMNDAPAIFHTGDTFYPEGRVEFSHPIRLDNVAVKHPEMKIIMAHVGNPWIVDASEVIYKNKNVYGDLSGLILDFKNEKYTELIRRRVNDLIAYAGGEKLLFGTDFPLTDTRRYIQFVDSLDLSYKEKELTFFRNAERLFKIKV